MTTRIVWAALFALMSSLAHAADIVLKVNPVEEAVAILVQYGSCNDDGGIAEVWGQQAFSPAPELRIEGVEPVTTCLSVRWQLPSGELSEPEFAVVGP